MISRRITVTGRVQGVFFRYYACRKAIELNLNGTVENTPSGKVIINVFGTSDSVAQLIEWCNVGSPMARVDKVAIEIIPELKGYSTFSIKR